MVEGAAVGAGADEWVGIRHTNAGQEAVLQIVSFTFDYWNGGTASGTVDDEGEVMVCWWDPDDPENNNACAESTITDGIWEVTGLGGEPHFDPLAYRWDDDGDSQVIRPTS